ncbi:MAG: IMP cyclohydrolase [Clostridia bacterium]|nr:IMP cyclohydrolase [Clostridia bacterium]
MEREIMKISELLKNNTYPGRGIVIGYTKDGKKSAIAYFIMGRSVNSRNRVFLENGDDVMIKAFDESKLSDPSLVIYSPLRVLDEKTIVTNGDQTDTVYEGMKAGGTFEGALRTRMYEPDEPNYTPRISGIVSKDGYKLSILKYSQGTCLRETFDYEPLCGTGHFIHTYKCDGNPIPTFEGEPNAVEIADDAASFAKEIWESLNEDNKVSLLVRYTDNETMEKETVIINKNK